MPSVIRYDTGKLSKVKKHDKGFLTAMGSMSRTGIQNYYDSKGNLIRELRLPEDVFKQESLDSFNNIPVTDDHPRVIVNTRNAKQFSRGLTQDKSRRDNDFVINGITVTDQDLIDKVFDGKSELSLGYECMLDFTAGVHPVYGKYDAIQRNIKGNHLAIVDRARAGRNAKLHLDSENNAIFNQKVNDMTKKLKINDKEFEVNQEVFDAVEKALLDAKTKNDALETEKKTLETENEKMKKEKEKKEKDKKDSEKDKKKTDSELKTELDTLKAKYDSLLSSISQKAKEYSKVMDTAKKVLSDEEFKKLDGKSLMEIKKETLQTHLKDSDISEKEDTYISVRFDMINEEIATRKDSDNELGKFLNSSKVKKQDEDFKKLKKDKQDKVNNNWKGGLND